MAESIIPEIDISALIKEDASPDEKEEVLKQLRIALEDIGFLSIVGHGVSMELIDKMDRAGRSFFALPKKAKMSIAPRKWNPENTNRYRGYFPASVFGKEGLDMADPEKKTQTDPNSHLTEINKFPKEFEEDKQQIFKEYFTALHKLGTILLKAIFRLFQADDSVVDEMLRRPDLLTTFRLNYYPQHEEGYEASEISAQDGVKLACETHTDSVLITILYQDEIGGLQVQCPKTGQWHNVPCNRKAFVVNTGKTINRLTNDRFKATFHRVLLGKNERMSIPFFVEPVREFKVDARLLLPDEEPLYPVITYGEQLLKTNATFKEYQRDDDEKK